MRDNHEASDGLHPHEHRKAVGQTGSAKAEITNLAQREGYRIIRWYEDHGAELNAFLLGSGFGKVRIDARREAIADLGNAIQFVDVILQQSHTMLIALDRSRFV